MFSTQPKIIKMLFFLRFKASLLQNTMFFPASKINVTGGAVPQKQIRSLLFACKFKI